MNRGRFAIVAVGVIVAVIFAAVGYIVATRWARISPLTPPPVAGDQTTESPPAPQDETADWEICRNERYGYEVRYPPEWKVWKTGAGEALPARCEENLALLTLSSNFLGTPGQPQISIDVSDPARLKSTIYKGTVSLDDYFNKNPAVLKYNRVVRETEIGGERALWLEGPWLVTFHDDSIFEFHVNNVDAATLQRMLDSFRFLESEEREARKYEYHYCENGLYYKFPRGFVDGGVVWYNASGEELAACPAYGVPQGRCKEIADTAGTCRPRP